MELIDALGGDLTEEARADLPRAATGSRSTSRSWSARASIGAPAGVRAQRRCPDRCPQALYEPLVARLYATPAALPVAATAAAAGQQVDRALLAAAMSIGSDELDATLAALVEGQILEPVAGGRYRFRHELLREVAYELQPPSWRRKVHDRLCDLLATDDPADWYVLASHYELAERHHEAAAAYQQTAEWARRRGALDEARAHLKRAIDLVVPLASDAARDHREVELRLRRGFLAMAIEGAASEEASAGLRPLPRAGRGRPGQRRHVQHADLALAALAPLARELDRARDVTATLRASLEGKRDRTSAPRSLGGFGLLDWFEGDFDSAVETLFGSTTTGRSAREHEAKRRSGSPRYPTRR